MSPVARRLRYALIFATDSPQFVTGASHAPLEKTTRAQTFFIF
jgi:hypothetical protein